MEAPSKCVRAATGRTFWAAPRRGSRGARLLRHLQRHVAIPGTVRPSLPLHSHPLLMAWLVDWTLCCTLWHDVFNYVSILDYLRKIKHVAWLVEHTRWYPARCRENFLNKILRWNVKVVTPKIFVCKRIIYESMLFCWEWIILKSPAGILWCDIHAISHRKSIEDINMWFGGWWHGV
jgi:hypothetical protein